MNKNDSLYLFYILVMLTVILAWLIRYNEINIQEIKNVGGIEICMGSLKVY